MRRALALLALLLAAPGAAQETVTFKLTPPGGKPRLADAFDLRVTASYPAKYDLALDTASLAGEDFELLEHSASQVREAGGVKERDFKLRLQAFTLGVSTFPALAWHLRAAGAPPSAARSPSFILEILPAFEDAKEELRDIYPPINYIPWPWIVAGLLAAAAAAALLHRRFGGRAAPWAAPPWTDTRTPHSRALDRLGAVRRSPLAAAGKLKEYYIGLTSVLRLYLFEEFGIEADLMTTSDLSRALKRTGADLKTTLTAREFLQKADLVKFAKHLPSTAGDDAALLENLLNDFNAAADRARAIAASQAAPPKP